MIIHGTSFHFPRPTHDKRDSYTTFITLALQATQFSVTTKKFRVSPSLFMRAIITTKSIVSKIIFRSKNIVRPISQLVEKQMNYS